MSSAQLSQNENSNSNGAIVRSLSSARFQVAKVSTNENNSDSNSIKNPSVASGQFQFFFRIKFIFRVLSSGQNIETVQRQT